jgi:multidrug efflux system membrane fusion protein
MRSPASITGLCAGMLALGSGALVLGGCSSRGAVPEPPRNAIVAHPQADAAANAEVYSGDVHARYESQLGFRVAGKIKARLVDVGAHVEAGQALAELDPMDLKLQAASAQANLTSARANRDLAQSEYNRYRALVDKHYVSQIQFETKANALKAAQAQAEQAQAALAVARNQAEYTMLRADHTGVITTITAETGQVVAAGQTIATLARDGAVEVEIALPENRIADYRKGTVATIEAWADAGKRLSGHLREVAPEADRVSRTYRVRVTLDDADAALRLGQTARVYFVDAARARQNLIPLSALSTQNGKPAVWIVDAKTHQVRKAPVDVVAYREQGAVLDGGIAAQQWIVAAGVHKLRDGEAIAPVDALNRPVTL